MSIAFKKFLSMLDNELANKGNFSDEQKTILKKLCEKIYVLETSDNSSQIPNQLKEEIKYYAKELGTK